jgi:hypothetical protein
MEPEAAQPSEEPATDPLDELFQDSPSESKDMAPVQEETPVEPAPVAKEPADEMVEDLFGPPAKEDTPAEEPAMDEFEDLFGAPAKDEVPAEKPAAEEVDDIFAPPPKKAKPDIDPFSALPSRELPMRTWVDNTGNYQVEARLVVITAESVRLLKENGRTTTVPMSRLSDGDRDYVEQMVAQIGYGELGQFAAR